MSQPIQEEFADLTVFSRDLEDVAVLVKQTKKRISIKVKDIGTTLTPLEGETFLKFSRILFYLGEFEGFDLRRKDRTTKTACFCCGDIHITLEKNDFQERGQKLFRTDWVKKQCPNHPSHNTISASDDDNPSQLQHP